LKNPILSIKLLAQLLHDHGMLSDEERTRFTTTIISSSDQMARIINNLLDVNAIERGGMKLDMTAIDLSVAAYTVYEEYERIAGNKGVQLYFESQSDAECLADQTAMTQILDNLVSNAVKYSPSGKNVWVRVLANRAWDSHPKNGISGVGNSSANGSVTNGHGSVNGSRSNSKDSRLFKDSADISLATTSPLCIRIEIQDEGPGLSDDDKKKLFGKFVRLSAQPTAGERSTGLGLSIVKKMVTAMHGHVWCESELGKGATFVVELPQLMLEQAESEQTAPDNEAEQ
jgi:signal transduction histidine kinase